MVKKVLVIGSFYFKTLDTGGQPVKTRYLLEALQSIYGKESVLIADGTNWKRHPISFFFKIIHLYFRANKVIMLPAHNGLRVYTKLLSFLHCFKKNDLYYDVVGGWIVELIQKHKNVSRLLMRYKGIWVETNNLSSNLQKHGFNNVNVLPNFKCLKIATIDDLDNCDGQPFRLVTFSRVNEKKGISDAINAVRRANEFFKGTVFVLDIFGPIDEDYFDVFTNLLNEGDFATYKGVASPDSSVDILKEYYCLLFPTKYFNEGIPGTIIDSLSAGVPVVYSKWNNCDDVLENNITGFGYEFDNFNELLNLLKRLPSLDITSMKKNCVIAAEKYSYDKALSMIDSLLRD